MNYKEKPGNIWEWLVYAFALIMRNCFPDLSIMHFTKRTNPYGLWFLPRGRETAPGYYGIQGDIALSSPVEEFVKHLWSPVVIGHIFCKQPEKLTAVLQCPNIDYAWAIRCAYEELTKWHRSEPEVAFPLLEIILPKMTDPNLKMTEDDRKNWIEITCKVCSALDFSHELVMDFRRGNNHSFLNRRCKLFSLLLKDENCLKALKSNSVWKELRDYLVKKVWASEHIEIIKANFVLNEEEEKSLQQRLADVKFRKLKALILCFYVWNEWDIEERKSTLYILGYVDDMSGKDVDAKWAEIKSTFIQGIEADTVEGIVENALKRAQEEMPINKEDMIRIIKKRGKSVVDYFPNEVKRRVLVSWVRESVKELLPEIKGIVTCNEIYPSVRVFMNRVYDEIPTEVSKPIDKLTDLSAFYSPENLWNFVEEYLCYFFVEHEKEESTKRYFDMRVFYFISEIVPVLLQTEVAESLSDEDVGVMWYEYYTTLSIEEKASCLRKVNEKDLFKMFVMSL